MAKNERRNTNNKEMPFTGGNPYQMKAVQELRRSSAASPHVPLARKGTRVIKIREALDDQECPHRAQCHAANSFIAVRVSGRRVGAGATERRI